MSDDNVSYDGITYKKEKEIQLFGAYFFLDNDRHQHFKKVYNIIDLLTELGGFQGFVLCIMHFLGTYINS